MRWTWMTVLLLFCVLPLSVIAPRAASWTDGGVRYLATLDGGMLHLGRISETGITDIATLPAADITTLVIGQWQGTPALLGVRDCAVLRFAVTRQAWLPVGELPAPIRELLPSPDLTPTALALTGTTGDPAPTDGAVWWVSWTGTFTCTRVTAVKDTFRPWQLWWTHAAGEQRFAAATYKRTPYVHFEHNCMFIFGWKDGTAEARWLGSRLGRPYVDATHADLRGDQQWRMVAVEVAKDGGHGLSVYRPIGFGYEGEWRADTVAGLERVAAYGALVLCWGHDDAGKPCAWRLIPDTAGYHLAPLPAAPPSLEAITRIDDTHIAGWWDGAWQQLALPDK